ncbi:phosphoribosylformylglycinamidine synthase subunit PurQ [candidate division KSB1 bacterium]|nr:phosphoribosylformylglycinamidine synthase subunit PurQ [candidate division KSB1 bacterium]
MRFGVVVFPGSNCDHDCYYVLKNVLGQDVSFVWHKETLLEKFDGIVLPGGFSYGDYLRTGAVARFSPIMEEISRYVRGGGSVLGICNGFQILLECGLLPGAMLPNSNLKFICKNVHLRVENTLSNFTHNFREGEVLKMPIAHAEGNYYVDKETLKGLEDRGQIVFRYCTPDGEVVSSANPNGSVENIAGICDQRGRVLGMMPHPERCAEGILGGVDGRKIFESWLQTVK